MAKNSSLAGGLPLEFGFQTGADTYVITNDSLELFFISESYIQHQLENLREATKKRIIHFGLQP